MPLIEAIDVSRRFGAATVVDSVSLEIEGGEIHALLGPNGAGKTTLLRVLAGLSYASAGTVKVCGFDMRRSPRSLRQRLGFVAASDRAFYLRLSGLENLVFFARLHGSRRRDACQRAREVLDDVGLGDAADRSVNAYSHGMIKRLAVARALLTDPAVLLVDEATHDLDPAGGESVRALVRTLADRGTAVLWTTQRLDEIRGFADGVTLLHSGAVRFQGTVAGLAAHATPRRHVVHVENGGVSGLEWEQRLRTGLAGVATVEPASGAAAQHYVLALNDGAVLSDALSSLTAIDVRVYSCRAERSELEEAFLSLTKDEAT